MKQPVLFAAFTACLVASFYAAFRPDFLKVKTILFRQEFGIFQTCFREGSNDLSSSYDEGSIDFGNKIKTSGSQFSYCQDFPSNCNLKIPNQGEQVKLTFCQAWLVLRYTQIAALVFGVLSWISWTLSGVERVSAVATSSVLIFSLLFGMYDHALILTSRKPFFTLNI